jgi:hypothetical protein
LNAQRLQVSSEKRDAVLALAGQLRGGIRAHNEDDDTDDRDRPPFRNHISRSEL